MRVLLTGASGFIGRAVADALLRRGHTVVRAQRQPRHGDHAAVQVDFAQPPDRHWWLPRLARIDAVVNAEI